MTRSATECFFAPFSSKPCEGPLRKAHLITKASLKLHGHDPWDKRAWVYACGGWGYGNEAHHAEFDSFKLTIPREKLPWPFVEMCIELGGWAQNYLDRRFGTGEGTHDEP